MKLLARIALPIFSPLLILASLLALEPGPAAAAPAAFTPPARAVPAGGVTLQATQAATSPVTTATVYLPLIYSPEPAPTCPLTSTASFNLIPFEGAAADHPDYLHGDLNLALRSYEPTSATLDLVDGDGGDPDPPKLAALIEPPGFPGIQAAYQVYDWDWGCDVHGCRGELVANPEVTLIGLKTTPGQSIYVPERNQGIWGDNIAMVLYAEERRITLGYTRQDSVASGYAVHLENLCVDPNLVALYQAQIDADGWRKTGQLPALEHRQVLGTALATETQAAIRDRGAFLDPRTRGDWWE